MVFTDRKHVSINLLLCCHTSCITRGLAFGPSFSLLCIKLLSTVTHANSLTHYSFADDFLLQMSTSSCKMSSLIQNMQSCINCIKA